MTVHDEIIKIIQKSFPLESGNTKLQIPPASLLELQGEFLEYTRKKQMRIKFPIQAKHLNPLHLLQGGIIASMIDATMGPLCYLAAESATITLDLHVSYLRGIEMSREFVYIRAWIVGRGRNTLTVEAEATDENGKIFSKASSQVLILKG
jgi:uncharacterized protein (TIGR00369 family)